MARVVQRRGAPPYLLILFVFLFVIATVLAILFYVWDSDKAKKLDQRDQGQAALSEELRKAKDTDIPNLAKKITGRTLLADAAIQEADRFLQLEHAKARAHEGLNQALQAMNDEIDRHRTRIAELERRERELADAVAKQVESNENLKNDYERKLKDVQDQLAKAQDDVARSLADKDAQRDRALAEKDAMITRLEQKTTVLTQQKDEQVIETQKRDAQIATLRQKIRDILGTPKVGPWALRKGDGSIVKALPDQKVVFIDVGEKENVKPGLPFSVYSREQGIPEDGQPKAKILVVNVGPTTSECRVVEPSKEDPITEGDVVANVVFDTSRVHRFVVEGEFDLYGEGQPDPLGNRRVRLLVESFGGKVMDVVSVDTDFAVMGEEPPRPTEPAGDAPAHEWQLYTDRMQRYNHYKQVYAAAQTLQIPVLNTARFLAFSGYVPVKRLSE
jgi:hypothetical protein